MSAANETAIHASYLQKRIDQHQVNVDYWIIVNCALLEEEHLHMNKRWYRREHKKITRHIRVEAKQARKLKRKHARLMKQFLIFQQQEGWV